MAPARPNDYRKPGEAVFSAIILLADYPQRVRDVEEALVFSQRWWLRVGRSLTAVALVLPGAAWSTCPADRGQPGPKRVAQLASLANEIDGKQYPHEPAGFEIIAANKFSMLPMERSALAGEWHAQKRSKFVLGAPDRAGTAAGPLEFDWPKGLKSGHAPVRFDAWDHLDIHEATRYQKVYISTTVRICGPDFENQTVGTKLWYVGYGNTKQYNDAFLMLQGNYKSTHVGNAFKLIMYISPADDREAPSHGFKQNISHRALVTVGDWHQIEVYLDAGTPNHSDGAVKIWVDGTKVTDRSGIKFLDTDYDFTQGFFRWQWTPVWGGVGGVRDRDDRMQIRDVYLSGVRQ